MYIIFIQVNDVETKLMKYKTIKEKYNDLIKYIVENNKELLLHKRIIHLICYMINNINLYSSSQNIMDYFISQLNSLESIIKVYILY